MPTVVGLMVEPVRQRRRQLLLEFFRRRDAAVFDRPGDAAIINSGVSPNDHVVVEGQLRLHDGSKVEETVRTASNAAPGDDAATGAPQ